MPCTMTGSIEGDRAWAAEQTIEKLSDTITDLTRMLCGACDWVTGYSINMIDEVDGLRDWWEEHQKVDQKKVEDEAWKNRHQLTIGSLTNAQAEQVINFVRMNTTEYGLIHIARAFDPYGERRKYSLCSTLKAFRLSDDKIKTLITDLHNSKDSK